MRPIDAEALALAMVEKGQANERGKYRIGEIWELNGEEILEVINSAPIVKPERKKGSWLNTGWLADDFSGWIYECSVCKYVTNDDKPNFCPNCGARMREEQR